MAIAFPSSVIARRAQPDEAIASNVFLSFGGSIEGGFLTPSNIEHPPQYSTKNLSKAFKEFIVFFSFCLWESSKGSFHQFEIRDCFSREKQMYSFAMTE